MPTDGAASSSSSGVATGATPATSTATGGGATPASAAGRVVSAGAGGGAGGGAGAGTMATATLGKSAAAAPSPAGGDAARQRLQQSETSEATAKYKGVAKKLANALVHEERRCSYVSREVRALLDLRDEMTAGRNTVKGGWVLLSARTRPSLIPRSPLPPRQPFEHTLLPALKPAPWHVS